MNIEEDILKAIAHGKKIFSPSGESPEETDDFQEVAKYLIHCGSQGWLDSIKPHKGMRSSRLVYDQVFIPNGLSYSGNQYLKSVGLNTTHADSPKEDIVDLKPNFMGIGININALIRWWKTKK